MQKRNVIIAIVAIIAVSLMAAITILVLLAVHRTTNHPTVKSDTVVTQTAQSVITQLQKDTAANTILKGSTVSLVSSNQPQLMYVLDTALNKYVQVTVSNGALITEVNGYNEQQLKLAISDVTLFLAKQGLSTTQQTNDSTALLTVSNKDLICQVKTLSQASGPVLQIQLLCINHSSYNDQLSVISHLLSLWGAASSSSYNQLSLETITKAPYTIALLHAIPKSLSSAHVLIFVKDRDTWTYIGDAGAGVSVIANDKYVINQSIKDGLDNSHYGLFLHDILFGSVKTN
jgi:hypothetical protein